ncbi:MAG TPA: DUF72 domain-containing protein [Cyclobacteriaceae bacterium]
MQKQGIVRIGTSGIVLPVSKMNFPEGHKADSRLAYYSSIFNTVEINSSFYRVPMPSTFQRWSADVPLNFKFSVKLWREITHKKELAYDLNKLKSFLTAADNLGDRKGCLLIQLPPSLTIDNLPALETLITRIQKFERHHPWHICVEFRNASWYTTNVEGLCKSLNVSIVMHDMPGSVPPEQYGSMSIVYKRFHGTNGKYSGSYSEKYLTHESQKVVQHLSDNSDVYLYFNNTIDAAFYNATFIKEILSGFSP